MSRSVVVTGASGFLGAAVVAELARRGENVLAVSRRSSPAQSGAEMVQVSDYRETPAPDGAILIHLAEESAADAVAEIGQSRSARRIGALLAKGYDRTVYASSAIVYGDSEDRPRRVTDAAAGQGPYVAAKLACEALVLETTNGVVARLANVFGPGMTAGTVVDDILCQLAEDGDQAGAALTVRDPTSVRDFLWIEDAAAGLADMAVGEAKGIFNLGGGVGWSIGQLAAAACKLAGQEAREIKTTTLGPRHTHLVLDIAGTEAAFGWRPRVSVEDGLRRMVARR